MEQQLSIITIGSVRKRIKREIENLIRENICIEDDIKIYKFNKKPYKK